MFSIVFDKELSTNLSKKNLTYLDDPSESEFLDGEELPFVYTKDVCDGLPTPSNIWMPVKDKITSASDSKILSYKINTYIVSFM